MVVMVGAPANFRPLDRKETLRKLIERVMQACVEKPFTTLLRTIAYKQVHRSRPVLAIMA
jgi:hypothetical protein